MAAAKKTPPTASELAAQSKLLQTYEELKKVRKSTTLTLKACPFLRPEIDMGGGKLVPLRVRHYQTQGIYHLLAMKRLLLGDGTGLGKTLSVISALSYTWMKETDNKAIVIAPKSALRQWASEIHKFTTGIRPILAVGSLDERKKAYQDFQDAPVGPDAEKVVLILNYAILVRDWDAGASRPLLPNGRPDPKTPVTPGLLDSITTKVGQCTVVYDECFDHHTPILLEDGSTELIGRIVSKKIPARVMSYNWETRTLESKAITNWFRNPLPELLNVTFRFSGKVNVTKNHKFYNIDGGYFLAEELVEGKDSVCIDQISPSSDQHQVLWGTLLGDGSLTGPERHTIGLTVGHSTRQERYLNFKRDILMPLGTSDISYYQTEYQKADQRMCRFLMHTNVTFSSNVVAWGIYNEGRKCLKQAWLDQIGPLGLAVWYGDDGSVDTHVCVDGTIRKRITLNTQGYTSDEQKLLKNWLRSKWGVKAKITAQFSKTRNKKYEVLYLDADAAEVFLSILPGALPGVEYKWPEGTKVVNLAELDTQPKQVIVKDYVLSVKPWIPGSPNKKYVYDIEVEDNHNYFAGGSLVSNCTAFKNPSSKTWQVCRSLSDKANRCYGLTATLLKNNLMEGFSILKVIQPSLFSTKTKFMDEFCVTKLQPIAGGRKVPIVVGYRNLEQFRLRIDPYFLGRNKHEVSNELPLLITKQIAFELSPAENAKYSEALTGILQLGDGEVKDYEHNKALTSLIYCQQIVNSLAMLKFNVGDQFCSEAFEAFDSDPHLVKEMSTKESTLMDLLTEELDGEKVIVYTRFASIVPRLQELLKKQGVKSAAITGKVKDTDRQKAQNAFQDHDSDTKVIFITDAGSEAINLQTASAMVFFDAPWSWGTYVQLLGRPVRIGSIHQSVVVYHLVAERPGTRKKDRMTIDRYTLELLEGKKDLVDKVLGEAAVGALDFSAQADGAKELLRMMKGSI